MTMTPSPCGHSPLARGRLMENFINKIMTIIDGKKIREKILTDVKERVAKLPFAPVFCDVLVGENEVSAQYVRMKAKTAESVGISFHHASFPETITTEELVEEIKKLNKIENMCGLIVQLPLPLSIDKETVCNAIDANIDVDFLGKDASEKFYNNQMNIGYPTAMACVYMLDSLKMDLSKKKIIMLGQGELVGRPVLHILKTRGLDVTPVTRKTENKDELIASADVIISGIGKGKNIKGDMIKEGAVLIDAGTSESTSGIVGDVDLESVKEKASFVSPVPGGVGPVTVAMLLQNVLIVAEESR